MVRVPGYITEMYCVSCEIRTEFICYVEESKPPLCSSSQSFWLRNGEALCFLWGMNWIYICYVEESRPPLWSGGQRSWLQIQSSGFDSQRYQIFWEVVSMERCSLSLVSTIEDLLERKSSGSGLEIREFGRRVPSRLPCGAFYPQKLALTSPTSGHHSVYIACSQTQATEFFWEGNSLGLIWDAISVCAWKFWGKTRGTSTGNTVSSMRLEQDPVRPKVGDLNCAD
jgi:hypothetical protein